MRLITSAIAISLLALSLSPAQADSRHDSRRDNGSHDSRDRGRYDRNDHRDRDRGRHESRRDDRHYSHHDRRDHHRYSHNDRRYDYDRRDRRYVESHRYYYPPVVHGPVYRDRFYMGSYHRPHGYRTYSWRRGDRLPSSYYAPRYVVRDYHSYRLGAPPHGHHWVRVDNDVILAAITTGIVVQVVSDLFH